MVRGSWVGVNLSLSQCRPVLHCADPSRGCYVSASQALAPCTLEATTIRKLQTHIIPFVFVLFMIAFVDRINIGFAALNIFRRHFKKTLNTLSPMRVWQILTICWEYGNLSRQRKLPLKRRQRL